LPLFFSDIQAPATYRRLGLPNPGGCSWARGKEVLTLCWNCSPQWGLSRGRLLLGCFFLPLSGESKQPPTAVYVTTGLYHKCWPTSVYIESMYKAYYYILA